MNNISLLGRLVKNPELRRTLNGTPVASFTLAVDRRAVNGERRADFIDCVAWRQTAEFINKYFAKGQMCAITGSLQVRNWIDNDGNMHKAYEIIANNIYFAGKKENTALEEQTQEFYDMPDDDEDLPF